MFSVAYVQHSKKMILHNRDSIKFFKTILKKFDTLRIILLFYIEKE